MDLPLEQVFALLKTEPGAGMVNSILLALILLSVRSLKKTLVRLEEHHDRRIAAVEVKQEKHESRLIALEKGV